jgi:hypothetical protein
MLVLSFQSLTHSGHRGKAPFAGPRQIWNSGPPIAEQSSWEVDGRADRVARGQFVFLGPGTAQL